ncbi:unnamed protein product (macronuclear) [Paramecium tetraurelia]|uniref:Uncharacterized protein n=1 Tax=Paramecium tetraurelia TaxID=5888 RepID=A0BC12_PARTE|nr:uncharacterized protein GSPATT00000515001 [Paramecium tetraurelia]CAK56079.1 unnamed protein product [Paramecium tetraurelia]|eukprot:XP_001423477.1 hypothetical protein (macronuclear) [Paramecium tetraurelia strain d4-2]
MNKQNIHNLDHGLSKVNDSINCSTEQIPTGNETSTYKLNFAEMQRGSERKTSKSCRDNLIYTPHQNKFYGYCQFPNQKLNCGKLTESRMTTLQQQSTISVERTKVKPQTSISKPQSASIMNGKRLKVKNSEILFQDNPYHLSGNMQDVIQNYQKSTIQTFVFRKGSSNINRNKSQTSQNQQRFVCKYINHRQINSPPINLINKFIINIDQQKLQNEQSNQTENLKITLGTDRGRLTIENDTPDEKQNRSLSKSLYQTLDLSLKGDTIQATHLRSLNTEFNSSAILCDQNNRKVSEIYQSFIFQSNLQMNQNRLITTKQQLENSQRLEKELELYPEIKQPQDPKKPKQYRTKIYTELELSKKEKDLNTNYLI